MFSNGGGLSDMPRCDNQKGVWKNANNFLINRQEDAVLTMADTAGHQNRLSFFNGV